MYVVVGWEGHASGGETRGLPTYLLCARLIDCVGSEGREYKQVGVFNMLYAPLCANLAHSYRLIYQVRLFCQVLAGGATISAKTVKKVVRYLT